MDERLKRSYTSAGRESRAHDDESRRSPEDVELASAQERRRAFRSEWLQEALPTPPEIPGFHLCWLSTTNQYDPIHKRLRIGYEPVKAEELTGFDTFKVKSGEYTGFVSCNEMLLYKMPMAVYQEVMEEMHHHGPLDEADKIRVQQEMLLENTRDRTGRALIRREGGGMESDQTVRVPTFK